MPIYAYKCASCGFAKDVLQKMSEVPLDRCPACGEPTFMKQLTAAGFQLKGSGWYATDFKSKPKSADGGGGKEDAGESSSQSDAGSDGKNSDGKSDGKPTTTTTEAKADSKSSDAPAAKPAAAPAANAPAASTSTGSKPPSANS